jgi:hypothetical protein
MENPCKTLLLELRLKELESTVKELIVLLERTEQTDDGRVFHPNQVRSCRAVDSERLDEILNKMKVWK